MRGSGDPFFPEGLPAPVGGPSHPPAAGPGPATPARRRPPGVSEVPDLFALARAVRARWPLALALGLVAGALAGAAAWKVIPPPKFTATAVVEVKSEKPNLLPGAPQAHTDLRIFQATQLSLVRSRLVINAALGRPGIADLPTVRAQAEPVDWLADELVAEFPAGSELMRLSLSGNTAGDLAALVNAVAEAYLEEVVTKDHNDRQALAGQLQELLGQYNEELTRQRARMKEMAESVGSDDKQALALKQQMAVQQLADEKRELLGVQQQVRQAKAELAVIQAAETHPDGTPDDQEIERLLERDPAVERYRMKQEDAAGKLDRARRLVRNEADPSVREARRTLEKARRDEATIRASLRPRIERELKLARGDDSGRHVAELETRVKILTEHEKMLTQGIGRLEGESQTFNRKSIDLQWLKDEIAQREDMARELGRRVEALKVELKAPQRGRLIERADSPRIESARKRLAGVALASLGAFGLAAAGVAWREYRLRRVGSVDDVADGLGLRLVGVLPALPGHSGGRGGRASGGDDGGGGNWEHLLVESIDAARAVLLRDCQSGDLRTILVTSASKGEGKSSLCGHLAISVARTGRRTLLIDLDLRSPAVHRLFDLEVGPGAAELLRGEYQPESVVVSVADELDVITAGRTDSRAVRALGQAALPDLLGRLSERYDLVVIDSAPLLPVADSLLISQHVDGVLLSVYREVSRLPAVHAGHERLAALGARVLGAVVTGEPVRRFIDAERYAGVRGG